jgi:hypothetical protein
MENVNWRSSIFMSDNFDAVNAYLYDNFSIRRLSSSRLCVYIDDSPSVDAKGNKIKVWKCFKCICGRTDDGKDLCPVKFLYKYNDNHCFEAFQSEGEHTASSSSGSNCRKRKLTELPESAQNALVSMVASGSQPANIVGFMKHNSLEIQKKFIPEAILKVIIELHRIYIYYIYLLIQNFFNL